MTGRLPAIAELTEARFHLREPEKFLVLWTNEDETNLASSLP